MIYQLPNGKIIHLSIEEYLDLTDQDVQYLMSINAGNHASSPWHGSSIKRSGRKRKDDEEDEDHSIDYSPDLDEPLHSSGVEEDFYEEDFPESNEDIS